MCRRYCLNFSVLDKKDYSRETTTLKHQRTNLDFYLFCNLLRIVVQGSRWKEKFDQILIRMPADPLAEHRIRLPAGKQGCTQEGPDPTNIFCKSDYFLYYPQGSITDQLYRHQSKMTSSKKIDL
jgi:hypothetical protein